MAVPLCRDNNWSDRKASTLRHVHKEHARFYQDDLHDEQVLH